MSDTAEVIQTRLLSNVDPKYDVTVGSSFYDIEKPVAIELEAPYNDIEVMPDQFYTDTATGTDLERRVADYGIIRKLSTYASTSVTIGGVVGSAINIGDKVASDNLNYSFTEAKVIDGTGSVTVNVECDTPGVIGNVIIGAIKYFPITIPGLISVTNLVAVSDGYEAESDDSLRQRYYEVVRSPGTSGNPAAYLAWAESVTGVGGAKVFPLWDITNGMNGNGSVKVTIINSNERAADVDLIDSVAAYIETVRPIGATVTVVSASEKAISITVTLTIDTNNYTLEVTIQAIKDALTAYFATLAFNATYISYAKIGNLLFDVVEVLDYSDLLVNGGTINIPIADEEIAVLGSVN